MKKLFLFLFVSLFSFLFSLGEARAYTSTDVSNATYLANENLIVKQSSTAGYRLDDTITRAEVMGIALKMKGVVLPNYQCKGFYTDTRNNDWICRAVELAADNGIITKTNTKARPQDSITRAEALAIVMKARGVETDNYLDPSFAQGREYTNVDITTMWQYKVFENANYLKIIDIASLKTVKDPLMYELGGMKIMFYPNRPATRAEVFSFVKNILSGSSNNGHQYEGFTANFDGENLEESKGFSYKRYNFGNIKNLGGTPTHEFYIQVDPIDAPLYFGLTQTLEKKYWKGNPYYSTMLTGMCGTGGLVFIGTKNIITSSGSCNQTIEEIENILKKVSFNITGTTRVITSADVLRTYYSFIENNDLLDLAYDMRSPVGVSRDTFYSWYKNVTAIEFREDTLKDIGDSTFEFLINIRENGITSTYKVKSKVDLENFKINNISSVKQ